MVALVGQVYDHPTAGKIKAERATHGCEGCMFRSVYHHYCPGRIDAALYCRLVVWQPVKITNKRKVM